MNKILGNLKSLWQKYQWISNSKLTEAAEYELEELEHVFSILVFPTFVGLPAAPLQISLELLPLMEKDLHKLLIKEDTAAAPLSDLASIFEVG